MRNAYKNDFSTKYTILVLFCQGYSSTSEPADTIPFIAHHTHSSRPPFSPPASTTAALALTTAAEYALSIAIAFPF